MTRHGFFRSLRIAISAVCGMVCLLLVLMWVRSNSVLDQLGWYDERGLVGAGSFASRVAFVVSSKNWRATSEFEYSCMSSKANTLMSFRLSMEREIGIFGGFGAGRRAADYALMFPHWFLVAFFAALACAPWFHWRFSLRTLLIVTTVVALLLGLAAMLSR
jgi:hypothetical protein